MFERPDFTDPAFAEHVWYFDSYKNAIVPRCRGRVLDIGAGHAYLSRAAAEKDEVISVVATDRYYDPRLAQNHPKLRIVTIATERLIERREGQDDFGEFDTIIATEHVEHLPEPLHRPLLAFIRQHLAKGGAFLGSMPHVNNSGNPFHLREYLAEEWQAVLRTYFEEVELWFPSPLLYVWRAA